MIAPDHDRRRQLAARDQVVQRHTEPRALALAEPADACRQPLKVNPLTRERDPPLEMLVVRKQLEDELVRPRQIPWIAGERDPAERTFPFAEEGTDVLRDEPGNLEGVFNAGVQRHGAEVVAIVERDR